MKFELPGQLRGPECRRMIYRAIALRRRLDPWFASITHPDINNLSIMLRIDGSPGTFGLSGVGDVASRHMHFNVKRIVSMLTRMAMKFDGVSESSVEYAAAIDYEHEHEREPEPGRVPEDRLRGFANGESIVRPR